MSKMANLVKIDYLTKKQIAFVCDHTFLKTVDVFKDSLNPRKARTSAYENFLEETMQLIKQGIKPATICVYPSDIFRAKKHYLNNLTGLCSVVGFPHGSAYSSKFKMKETELALSEGATEIDMVLNDLALKNGHLNYVEEEVQKITHLAHDGGALVKLIFENCELQAPHIQTACKIAKNCGVDFIKTSTGFGSYGATEADLVVMKYFFDGGIKMAGGVGPENVYSLLKAVSGRKDGQIDLDPIEIRIGESSLLKKL